MDEQGAFPAEPTQVASARHWARERVPTQVTDDVELIVSELVTNAVRYGAVDRDGGPATVTVRLATTDTGRLAVTVTNPTRPHQQHPGPDPDGERGRGLALVIALADHTTVDTTPTSTTVHAEVALPGAPVPHQRPGEDTADDPPPACPGRGNPHYIATASGPGGRATVCTHCRNHPPKEAPMLGRVRNWIYADPDPGGHNTRYVRVSVPDGEPTPELRPETLADVPPHWPAETLPGDTEAPGV